MKYSGTSIIQTPINRILDYLNTKWTAQLGYFVKSVCFIRVVESRSVYKCMDVRSYVLSIIQTPFPPN